MVARKDSISHNKINSLTPIYIIVPCICTYSVVVGVGHKNRIYDCRGFSVFRGYGLGSINYQNSYRKFFFFIYQNICEYV